MLISMIIIGIIPIKMIITIIRVMEWLLISMIIIAIIPIKIITNLRVMEWLRHVDLSEYAPNLRGSGVHGALLIFEDWSTAHTRNSAEREGAFANLDFSRVTGTSSAAPSAAATGAEQ